MCSQDRALRQSDGCFGPHNDRDKKHCVGSYNPPDATPSSIFAREALQLHRSIEHTLSYPATASPKEGFTRDLAYRAYEYARKSASSRGQTVPENAAVELADCGCLRFTEPGGAAQGAPCEKHAADHARVRYFHSLPRPETIPLVFAPPPLPPPRPPVDPDKAAAEFRRRWKENGGFADPAWFRACGHCGRQWGAHTREEESACINARRGM